MIVKLIMPFHDTMCTQCRCESDHINRYLQGNLGQSNIFGDGWCGMKLYYTPNRGIFGDVRLPRGGRICTDDDRNRRLRKPLYVLPCNYCREKASIILKLGKSVNMGALKGAKTLMNNPNFLRSPPFFRGPGVNATKNRMRMRQN